MVFQNSKIRIIGIGNPLMGDDGVGIAAVERLKAMSLPERVEVVDGGTPGLTLLDLMAGADKVILIDAVSMGKAPGAVVRFSPDEVVLAEDESVLSLHESGLPAVFAMGREMNLLPPRVTVFGVEPDSVEWRMGLSPGVEAALDELLERVVAEALQRSGE